MNDIEITCPRCAQKIGTHKVGLIDLLDKCTNCEFTVSRIHEVPNLRDCENVKIDMLDDVSKLESYKAADTKGV